MHSNDWVMRLVFLIEQRYERYALLFSCKKDIFKNLIIHVSAEPNYSKNTAKN